MNRVVGEVLDSIWNLTTPENSSSVTTWSIKDRGLNKM